MFCRDFTYLLFVFCGEITLYSYLLVLVLQIKKDKGCKKEIEQLRIGCQSSPPCGWEGSLPKLEVRT